MQTITNNLKYDVLALVKLGKGINRLDCLECNEGNSEKRNNARLKLLSEASLIAAKYNMYVYHQSDPRGLSLYLIPIGVSDENYNLDGVGF